MIFYEQNRLRNLFFMHPYIPHLLDDIKKAHRTGIIEPEVPKSFEEEMEAIERWCDGEDPIHNFGYYCMLQPENFPPVEQLGNEDIIQVNTAFCEMMNTWNLNIDLPEAMPQKVRYSFLVNTLNEKVDIVNSGFCTIDFCTGYAPDCKLKEYCPCLEFWNSLPEENMDDIKSSPGDLPF